MRTLRIVVVACVVLLTQAQHVRAEDCSVVDDPAVFDKWPLPQDATWAKLEATPSRQLYRIVELIETDSADDADSRAARQRLQAFIRRVLVDFDGTAASARWLRIDDVKPEAIAGDLNANGVPVVTQAWQIFHDPPLVVKTGSASAATCKVRLTFAAYVRGTATALGRWQAKFLDQAAETLAHQDEAWKNLITRGYSQYPWEVLVNGAWIDDHEWGPADNFMILLHAAVGAGVANVADGHGRAATASVVVALEPVGYVRYFANHAQYVGVAPVLTMNNLQTNDLGFGGAIHVSGLSLGASHGLQHDGSWTVFWLVDVTHALDDSLLTSKVPTVLRKLF